jgi:hypothetical protein
VSGPKFAGSEQLRNGSAEPVSVSSVVAVSRSLPTVLLRTTLGTPTARGHARKEVLNLFVTAWAATRGCDLARTVKLATAVRIAGGT